MSFTRAQLRTRILRRMDAVSSGRWDITAGSTGEVDQIMGFIFDKEWRRILSANSFYRTNKIQPTADANGQFAISGLTTGTGDTAKRFYRILGVVVNAQVYQEVTKDQYLLAPDMNIGYRLWFRDGDNISILPVEPNKVLSGLDGFHVNWFPTRIDNLSADGVAVDFPDGYEEILVLETAAWLLAKGGSETDTTGEFRAMATPLRDDMLADIQRISIAPMRMKHTDYSYDWAG